MKSFLICPHLRNALSAAPGGIDSHSKKKKKKNKKIFLTWIIGRKKIIFSFLESRCGGQGGESIAYSPQNNSGIQQS